MKRKRIFVFILPGLLFLFSLEIHCSPVGSPLDKKACVTSYFGCRGDHFHYGLDLWTQNMSYANILSIAKGVVLRTGCSSTAGNYIIVLHPKNKIISRHYHMSEIFVKKGQRVTKGSVLGTPGNTGRSTGVHLHIEIQMIKSRKRVDPIIFFRSHEIYFPCCN